ncbi:MAG TPA: SPOR domain-containing protein [Steroidobacteraceae bacterium]|nr:SPOR domain-containing protein [Steroidobacteraceae bacterium]
MDNRIKERLTGALILVALLVILVPEMLSGPETSTAAGDAPPARPATEGPPLRSYTLDLDAAADKNPAGQSALNAQSASAATEAAPAVPAPAESGKSTPAATAATPTESADPVAATTVPAPPPPPGPASTSGAASRGWQVQVGSFAQRVNAERYAQQLAGKGFKAQVSSSTGNGRELFRVRIGPVADRDAAVALQSRLAAQGIRGSLASP